MKNAISWFEIPTIDIDRAQKFYEAVFQAEMQTMDNANLKMRMFPWHDMDTASGAIVQSDFHKPSDSEGPLIYLNATPDVQPFLDRAVQNGGEVMVPKTIISPQFGHMAVMKDTEGNRIALHSA